MPDALMWRTLSASERKLVRVFQAILYGVVDRVPIRGGEPVVKNLTWVRKVKVLGDNLPHPLQGASDFVLRREITAFFRLVRQIGDGEIKNLVVRNGLPFDFEVNGQTP